MLKSAYFGPFMRKTRILIALGAGLCWSLAGVQHLSAQSTPERTIQSTPPRATQSTSQGATHAARPKKPSASPKAPDAFWAGSYAKALESANAAGRLVLVCLAPPSCPSCTVSSDKVLNRKGFLDSLKKECAAGIYLSSRDSDWVRLQGAATGEQITGDRAAQGQTAQGQATQGQAIDDQGVASFLYIDGDGTCLLRYESAAPGETAYLDGLTESLDRKAEMARVKILEPGRVLGDSDEANLEEIILEKAWAHQPVDSLLETYVSNLPVDSMTSIRVLRFLILQAPVLNSNANQLIRQDPDLFNQVWKGLSRVEQYKINNRVITKTWQMAIRDRDLDAAQLAASFAANTNRDPDARLRAFQGVLIEYHYGVGDTTQFLNLAGTYYDRFLMHFNADSLRRQDSLFHREGAISVSRFLAAQLQKAAERVSLVSSDPGMLTMAHSWAVRSVALCPTGESKTLESALSQRLADKGKTAAPF
jgi:hypothetical protein